MTLPADNFPPAETTPPATPASGLSETEARNLRAVSDVLAYWNTQNVQGILTFYNEDITWRNMAMEETYQGKQQVEQFIKKLFTAFPDLSFEVTDRFVRDNMVAEKWYIRGTHKGPFMGVPPTGRKVEIPGLSMVEMRDCKFLSDHFYYDSATVMRQMQLLPSLKATQSPAGKAALWLLVHKNLAASALLGAAAAGLAAIGLRRRKKQR